MNDIQKKQLEILKAFIRVYDKYNLRYFMVGGSALGAARHKGFIPWDDDIDVGMPREDYDKFMELQFEFEGRIKLISKLKSSQAIEILPYLMKDPSFYSIQDSK